MFVKHTCLRRKRSIKANISTFYSLTVHHPKGKVILEKWEKKRDERVVTTITCPYPDQVPERDQCHLIDYPYTYIKLEKVMFEGKLMFTFISMFSHKIVFNNFHVGSRDRL